MEKLFLALNGFMLGLRGVRKTAMEWVLKEMKEEWENLVECYDETEKALDDRFNECCVLKEEREKDKERIKELESQPFILSSIAPCRTWTVKVKRYVFSNWKPQSIFALRQVTNLSVEEAKELVELEINKDYECWFELSNKVDVYQLGMICDSLLSGWGDHAMCPQDVLITRN